jgi:hypothetical protein
MNAAAYLLRLPLLAVVACVHMAPVAPEARSSEMRRATTVEVETSCGGTKVGTGVIVSSRHVLTAVQNVGCADIPTVHVTFVENGVEHQLRMFVTDEDEATGIARLEIASAESFPRAIRPPVLRLPDPGNNVCANLVTGKSDTVACGTVSSTWTAVKRMPTRRADTGAPVYNDEGVLVGIVANRGQSSDSHYTWIAPIDARWLDGIVPETAAAREHVVVRDPEERSQSGLGTSM